MDSTVCSRVDKRLRFACSAVRRPKRNKVPCAHHQAAAWGHYRGEHEHEQQHNTSPQQRDIPRRTSYAPSKLQPKLRNGWNWSAKRDMSSGCFTKLMILPGSLAFMLGRCRACAAVHQVKRRDSSWSPRRPDCNTVTHLGIKECHVLVTDECWDIRQVVHCDKKPPV